MARFTRIDLPGKPATWCIAVESDSSAWQAVEVTRRNKEPVRMHTGTYLQPHPKLAGFHCYAIDRSKGSKAPTSGEMGENETSTGPRTQTSTSVRSVLDDMLSKPKPDEHAPIWDKVIEVPVPDASVTVTIDYDEVQRRIDQGDQSVRDDTADAIRAVETTLTDLAQSKREVTITVRRQDEADVVLDNTVHRHAMFETILKLMQMHNVMLVGPAGSGKSTLCEQLADALGCTFAHSSRMSHESQLLGYNDAGGNFVSTEFSRAYTKDRSVFLLDETDGTVPDAQVALNSAVESGKAPFANGIASKGKEVYILAAANTYGYGANSEYCGRYPLDGAFKNRWCIVTLNYDEDLELNLALASGAEYGADVDSIVNWVAQVQAWRKAKDTLAVKHIISPRASIQGAKDLAAFDVSDIAQWHVWQGLDDATVAKIKAECS